jgi:hypothetical protein
MFNNKTDLLDPLSVIVKLYIYSYKCIGTKISVKNNRLTIQDTGLFQSTVRTLMRDTKNDLNIIFNPIIFACDMYLKEEYKEKYKSFFEGTLLAFHKLKETYTGTDIVYTIDNLKTNVELFINNSNYDMNLIISNINEPSYQIKKQIYENISKIWSEKRLEILFGYLYELENYKTEEELNLILFSLSSFMDYIDLCTSNMISSLK